MTLRAPSEIIIGCEDPIPHRYREILRVGYSVATSPKDWTYKNLSIFTFYHTQNLPPLEFYHNSCLLTWPSSKLKCNMWHAVK